MFWPSYLNTPELETVSEALPCSPASPGGPPTHPPTNTAPSKKTDLSSWVRFFFFFKPLIKRRPLFDPLWRMLRSTLLHRLQMAIIWL